MYLSKLDRFDDAVVVLSGIEVRSADVEESEKELDVAAWARRRVVRDAMDLLSFCQKKAERELT